MSERRYFSGDTESQAVLEAAGLFGLEPRELAYSLVDKKHGFLRQRRRVVIVVDSDAPRREEAGEPVAAEAPGETSGAPASAAGVATGSEAGPRERGPSEAGLEAPPGATAVPPVAGSPREQVAEALELVLRLGAFEVDWDLEGDERGWRAELSGEEAEWLVEDEGKLLSAIEHLAGRLLWQRGVEPAVLRLDSLDFRQRRDAALAERVRTAAQRVLTSGQAETLEEMEPAERRLVHLAVEELPGVTTQSIGDGWRKRVEIRPA